MKVQINSLAALERLLGGDTAVEIEIRSNIVQEFAKKHLKVVANSDAVLVALDATKAAIIREAEQKLDASLATFQQDYYGNISKLQLKPEIVAEIRRQVAAQVDAQILKTVLALIEEKFTQVNLEDMVKRRVDYYTGELINDRVKGRLETLKKQL